MLFQQLKEQDAAGGGPAVDADVGRGFGAYGGEGGIVLLFKSVEVGAAAFMLVAQPLVGIALGGLAAEDGVAALDGGPRPARAAFSASASRAWIAQASSNSSSSRQLLKVGSKRRSKRCLSIDQNKSGEILLVKRDLADGGERASRRPRAVLPSGCG